jgi:hypothetical protein
MNKVTALLIAFLLTLSPLAFSQAKTVFVFAKIADPVMPIERGSKYEDPLDEALKKERLGEVTGGGSSLTKDRKIDWVGIDIEINDIKKGIPFLKRTLLKLGAPKESVLEYEDSGKKISTPLDR